MLCGWPGPDVQHIGQTAGKLGPYALFSPGHVVFRVVVLQCYVNDAIYRPLVPRTRSETNLQMPHALSTW